MSSTYLGWFNLNLNPDSGPILGLYNVHVNITSHMLSVLDFEYFFKKILQFIFIRFVAVHFVAYFDTILSCEMFAFL